MSFSFGTHGERKKATKRTRYGGGGGGTSIKGEGAYLHERMTKREMSSNQIAVFNLIRELERYPHVGKESRIRLKREMVEMEQLRVMNMKYLAATLALLDSYRDSEPSAEMFEGEVWDLVLQRLIISTGMDSPEQVIRHKEQILVYTAKVFYFRSEGEHQSTVSVDEIEVIQEPPTLVNPDDEI